ncbi:SDR family NAD(P)-dependent oxidoreductase [Niveispirillum sp.]|uniref:SDR family NAD(P)-dependent oxidoreductase n=1 Tax=Niveispirillum sp. TaxID=1917217 RepID=UPI001B3CD5A3|nr:glucose 1-dehydrogenase [Niveispirillum sp.]MBP7338514.1 glucose 1-dehydrogenase [Niveispirillum sp.]
MSAPVPNGRPAVVTGAARGIGLAVAARLAAQGAPLLLVDRDAPGLLESARLCRKAGAPVEMLVADLRDRASPSRIADAARRAYGGVAVLINNAGIEFRGDIQAHDDDTWDRVLDVNLSAAFRLTRALADDLADAPGGAIVNLASVAIVGFAGQAAYDASKGGLATLTRSLAVELGPRGVRANAVAPGFIDTQMLRDTPDLAGMAERFARTLPAGRLGTAAEVASAVAWLASPRASYVTGHTLFVDGGWMRR